MSKISVASDSGRAVEDRAVEDRASKNDCVFDDGYTSPLISRGLASRASRGLVGAVMAGITTETQVN